MDNIEEYSWKKNSWLQDILAFLYTEYCSNVMLTNLSFFFLFRMSLKDFMIQPK